ncbi:MAG: isochorismate synthase [Deltaproteobacteria bacterium]|nr:isochorismate synthase [Deltaproteobacteria bacterium]
MIDRAHSEPTVGRRFFFAGPTRTLAADDEGVTLEGTPSEGEALVARARALLAEDGSGFLVGAVPFDPAHAVRLFHPEQVQVREPWKAPVDTRSVEVPFEEHPDDAFVGAVGSAVEAIRRGALDKVVLARALEVRLARPPALPRLLSVLRARNPHGFTYALEVDAGRTLVGASPELLLSQRGRRVVSVPLAGSARRSADPVIDAQRAEALFGSAKDRHEHQLVVEDVVERLRPFVRDVRFEREPRLEATPSVWHLSTRIEGELLEPERTSLELALALHPTPAVCGLPTSKAREWIRHSEDFDRGHFTGTLGYTTRSGDGDWIVAIRCAEVATDRMRLFAGAGIVADSVPELELAETNAKMHTMLSAVAIAQSSQPTTARERTPDGHPQDRIL